MSFFIIAGIIGFVILIFAIVSWSFDYTIKTVSKPFQTINKAIQNRQCPYCKSDIPQNASVCRYCQRDLEPYKEPNAQEIVSRRKTREDVISDLIKSFVDKYPGVNFKFDNNHQRIKLAAGYEHLPKLNEIRKNFIEALHERDIDASSPLLDSNTINTIGIWENALERTFQELVHGSSEQEPLNKSNIFSNIVSKSERIDYVKEFRKQSYRETKYYLQEHKFLVLSLVLLISLASYLSVKSVIPIDIEENLSSEEYLKKGVDSYNEEKYKLAIPYLDRALEQNPELQKAYYYRGNSKLAIGDKRGANKDLRKAEALAYVDTALQKLDSGLDVGAREDFNKAVEVFSNAIWQNYNDADAWHNRALIRIKIGDLKDACSDLNIAINLGDAGASRPYNKFCNE